MKTTLSAQQSAFFTKSGFIELGIPHTLPPLSLERDLWRKNEPLKQFILRKLGPIALVLAGKKQIRMGLDQWVTKENRPDKASSLKEMFCLQGICLGALLAENPVPVEKRAPLGLLPLPSTSENILFFKPHLLLDWPHLTSDIFLILFTLPSTVYIHNPQDKAAHFLKQFGYHFGDCLKSATHPLIIS